MRVTDNRKGSVDTVLINVSQKPAPVLSGLSATPLSGPAPLTVKFNATITATGTISYTLFFDSGAIGGVSGTLYMTGTTQLSLIHAYPAGLHTANLTITDGKNIVSKLFPAVSVSIALPPSLLRIFSFTVSPKIGLAPLTVRFSTIILYTGNNSLTYTLLYNLKDRTQNATGQISNATRDLGTYVYPVGNYTPQLVVTDGKLVSTSTIRVNASK
jgi:PKD repeat protein